MRFTITKSVSNLIRVLRSNLTCVHTSGIITASTPPTYTNDVEPDTGKITERLRSYDLALGERAGQIQAVTTSLN